MTASTRKPLSALKNPGNGTTVPRPFFSLSPPRKPEKPLSALKNPGTGLSSVPLSHDPVPTPKTPTSIEESGKWDSWLSHRNEKPLYSLSFLGVSHCPIYIRARRGTALLTYIGGRP